MRTTKTIVLGTLMAGSILPQATTAAEDFDLDTGNAAVEVVIPTVAPVIFSEVSPTGGDAPLVLRVTTLTANAWFDATAPYRETALGVYTRLGRRPAEEATTRNINVATLYTAYRVFLSLLPAQEDTWRASLTPTAIRKGFTSRRR